MQMYFILYVNWNPGPTAKRRYSRVTRHNKSNKSTPKNLLYSSVYLSYVTTTRSPTRGWVRILSMFLRWGTICMVLQYSFKDFFFFLLSIQKLRRLRGPRRTLCLRALWLFPTPTRNWMTGACIRGTTVTAFSKVRNDLYPVRKKKFIAKELLHFFSSVIKR